MANTADQQAILDFMDQNGFPQNALGLEAAVKLANSYGKNISIADVGAAFGLTPDQSNQWVATQKPIDQQQYVDNLNKTVSTAQDSQRPATFGEDAGYIDPNQAVTGEIRSLDKILADYNAGKPLAPAEAQLMKSANDYFQQGQFAPGAATANSQVWQQLQDRWKADGKDGLVNNLIKAGVAVGAGMAGYEVFTAGAPGAAGGSAPIGGLNPAGQLGGIYGSDLVGSPELSNLVASGFNPATISAALNGDAAAIQAVNAAIAAAAGGTPIAGPPTGSTVTPGNPVTPPANVTPGISPPGLTDTPPVTTPPAGTPPVTTPPAGTPPVTTPPGGTPPVVTPPGGTPPVVTPPGGGTIPITIPTVSSIGSILKTLLGDTTVGGVLNTAAATVPGLMAIDYAKNQTAGDTAGLQSALTAAQNYKGADTNNLLTQQGMAQGYQPYVAQMNDALTAAKNYQGVDVNQFGPALNALWGYQGADTAGMQSVLNQLGGNQDAIVRAATDPVQKNIASSYGDLLQSQAQRGIRGSSFGDTDIANFNDTAGRTLGDVGATAMQQSLATQGTLAGQIQNQKQQGQEYGMGAATGLATNLAQLQQQAGQFGLSSQMNQANALDQSINQGQQFGMTQANNIANQIANLQQNAGQFSISSQQTGAKDLMDAQLKQQLLKNQMYGAGLNLLGQGLNPSGNATSGLSSSITDLLKSLGLSGTGTGTGGTSWTGGTDQIDQSTLDWLKSMGFS